MPHCLLSLKYSITDFVAHPTHRCDRLEANPLITFLSSGKPRHHGNQLVLPAPEETTHLFHMTGGPARAGQVLKLSKKSRVDASVDYPPA